MRYDPDLKQKVERLALAAKAAEALGNKVQEDRLVDALVRLCLPPTRSAATKWAPNYFSRVAQDIDQEVRVGLLQAFKAWKPEAGTFFNYMMYRPKRNVRRLKNVTPIDMPNRLVEVSTKKLTPRQEQDLERTRAAFYCGLALPIGSDAANSEAFSLAEIRASVPHWALKLLQEHYIDEVPWAELSKRYKLSRKKLRAVAEEAKGLLASVLFDQPCEMPASPSATSQGLGQSEVSSPLSQQH